MFQPQPPKILHVAASDPPSQVVARSLQEAGYRYIPVAPDMGVENALAVYHPDLILLDLDRLDPLLLRAWSSHLLSRNRFVPIMVMVTTYPDHSPIESADEICALNWGVDVYLRKPVSPRRLMARIRVLLRRSISNDPNPI